MDVILYYQDHNFFQLLTWLIIDPEVRYYINIRSFAYANY